MQMSKEMKFVNIDDLVPYSRNARTHSDEQIEQIRASIHKFGFVNPVIVDENLNIIAGHGRVLAGKAEGMDEVPCVFIEHLTEVEKRAYILADNQLALKAGWDMEKLKLELDALRAYNFDVVVIGFDDVELEEINSFGEEVDEVSDDDFNPVLPDEPVSKQGDLWLLGDHRLICGDATDAETVSRLMDGKTTQLIFTDPPWNVDYGGQENHPSWRSRQIMNDKMSTEDFHDFILAAIENMISFSDPGCMFYVVMSAQEWGNIMDVLLAAGCHWSSTVIWAKDALVLSRKDYHTQYEPIWYGWTANGSRLAPLEDRTQSDLWEIPRPRRSKEHPTMKPVPLVARAIQNSSRKGDVVLDLFGGSGTTMIAAQQTGRICHMLELDPKYADVIVKRFFENFPETTVKLNGNLVDMGKTFEH